VEAAVERGDDLTLAVLAAQAREGGERPLRGDPEFEAALDRDVLPEILRIALQDVAHQSKSILLTATGAISEDRLAGRTVAAFVRFTQPRSTS
jgi:hypothetical protein